MSKIDFNGWFGSHRKSSLSKDNEVANRNVVIEKYLGKRSESDRNSVSIEADYLKSMDDADLQVKKKVIKTVYNKCVYFLQSLEGKTIQNTVLSVDVVNSTAKVKTLSSEATGEYYQTFIENVSDLIEYSGGYVLKNAGDAVLGFFPCSKHYTENHDKAVLCGLNILDTIEHSLAPYYMKRGLPSIACRISADFGETKVLRVGSHGDYSAIDLFGSVMNSAAKISRYAMPNQMVIGDNLFWKLIHTDYFDFKLLNRWDLSGRHSYPVYLVKRKELQK